MHPLQSSIDILRTLLARLPPRFPPELGRCFRGRVDVLALDAAVTREEIDGVLVELGKYTWHFHKAWQEVYERDGRPMEGERLLAALPQSLAARVRSDAEAAERNAPDVVRLPVFEEYTPEDRLVIEEALLRAQRGAAEELVTKLEAGKIVDYDRMALRWKRERLDIEERLLALRDIARVKPELAGEITEVIHAFELGFARVVGREPTVAEVEGAIREYEARG